MKKMITIWVGQWIKMKDYYWKYDLCIKQTICEGVFQFGSIDFFLFVLILVGINPNHVLNILGKRVTMIIQNVGTNSSSYNDSQKTSHKLW